MEDRLAALLQSLPAEARPHVEHQIAKAHRGREAYDWAVDRLPRIASAGNASEVLSLVVDEARTLTRARQVWALLFSRNPRNRRASFEAFAGTNAKGLPAPADISNTVIARVIDCGNAVWSGDASDDSRFDSSDSVQTLRSVACVPITAQGVLYLADEARPDLFDGFQREQLSALCRVAGALLESYSRPRDPSLVLEPLPGLVGTSAPMMELSQAVRAFAPMPWPVLILGETGTGKELVARALHRLSPRAGSPFVAVNCGAIPEDLAESTLFGHERGAFTGADRQGVGVVDEVGAGTLFLDEVAELTPRLQIKLLRLLQEGTYRRVGGGVEHQFRGRILAATWRDVDRAGQRGDFREDLYYRIAACVVRVPPLRDRASDIPALAKRLVDIALKGVPGDQKVRLSTAAIRQLMASSWNGNVRELENVLRAAIARSLSTGAIRIEPAHLTPANQTAEQPIFIDATTDLLAATERFQQQMVHSALEATGGNRTKAAERLGVSRQWLYSLLTKWESASAG